MAKEHVFSAADLARMKRRIELSRAKEAIDELFDTPDMIWVEINGFWYVEVSE